LSGKRHHADSELPAQVNVKAGSESDASARVPPQAWRGQPAIRRYVEALLAKYPDLDDDNEDECPWSDSPLINNATGPIFYFVMVFSQAEAASAFARSSRRSTGSYASIRSRTSCAD
jgi:hypothetical protein